MEAQRREAQEILRGDRAPILDLLRRSPGQNAEHVMDQYRTERMRMRQIHSDTKRKHAGGKAGRSENVNTPD